MEGADTETQIGVRAAVAEMAARARAAGEDLLFFVDDGSGSQQRPTIGDRVRILKSDDPHNGREGRIVSDDKDSSPYELRLASGKQVGHYSEAEVKLISSLDPSRRISRAAGLSESSKAPHLLIKTNDSIYVASDTEVANAESIAAFIADFRAGRLRPPCVFDLQWAVEKGIENHLSCCIMMEGAPAKVQSLWRAGAAVVAEEVSLKVRIFTATAPGDGNSLSTLLRSATSLGDPTATPQLVLCDRRRRVFFQQDSPGREVRTVVPEEAIADDDPNMATIEEAIAEWRAIAMMDAVTDVEEAASMIRSLIQSASEGELMPAELPLGRLSLLGTEGAYRGETVLLPAALSRPSEVEVVVLLGRNAPDIFDQRDNSISRRHANIKARGGRLSFSDIGSSCGSSVNGSKIGMNAVELSVGDEITLGDCVFLLEENVF
jgi:hypothetical protein